MLNYIVVKVFLLVSDVDYYVSTALSKYLQLEAILNLLKLK